MLLLLALVFSDADARCSVHRPRFGVRMFVDPGFIWYLLLH